MMRLFIFVCAWLISVSAFAAPTGVTQTGGSTFPSASSLSSWRDVGGNAYKTLTDTGWSALDGGWMNIDTVCDKTPIATYRGIDLVTEDGVDTLKFSSLASDYPGRCRIKVIENTGVYNQFFYQARVKWSGMEAQIGNNLWNSIFTFYESSTRPMVLQLYSLTGQTGVYLRWQFENETIARDNVTAVIGNKSALVGSGSTAIYYVSNSSVSISDDQWYTLSIWYDRHDTTGSIIVWLDDTRVLETSGDTKGGSTHAENIAVGNFYPWVGNISYAWYDSIYFYEGYTETGTAPVITSTADGYSNTCPEGADPVTANYWLITDIPSYARGGVMTTNCAADYPDGYMDLPDAYDNPGGTAQGYLRSSACGGVVTVCAAASTTLGAGGFESDMVTIARTIGAEEGAAPASPLSIHSDTTGKAAVTIHSDTSGKAQVTVY